MSEGVPDPNRIIGELKYVLGKLEWLSPMEDANECERTIKGIIKQLNHLSKEFQPIQQTAQRIKPCWEAANRAYEWGLKHLPVRQHNFHDIHRAALARTNVPDIRIPSNPATFAKYVQRCRKAKRLPPQGLLVLANCVIPLDKR
jgi:hypothetical protein